MRSLSKHRMKLNRYRLSGAIHSIGIGATFCVKWLVTASSNVEAQAARPIHKKMVVSAGAGESSKVTACALCSPRRLFHAASTHAAPKATYPADQMIAWRLKVHR